VLFRGCSIGRFPHQTSRGLKEDSPQKNRKIRLLRDISRGMKAGMKKAVETRSPNANGS
jgi:hypothetical protein